MQVVIQEMYVHLPIWYTNAYKSLYLELQICTQTWNNYGPFEELRPDNMMIDHWDFVFRILVSLQKLGIANDVFKGFSQVKVLYSLLMDEKNEKIHDEMFCYLLSWSRQFTFKNDTYKIFRGYVKKMRRYYT